VSQFSKNLSWKEVSRKHIELYESIAKTPF